MSDYFRQHSSIGNFYTSESWMVLSDLEQQIKTKIEEIGTPLKNWDISIYRGVLTGFNEAFIIDESTRANLIAKDSKSAEVIKPILRGRDIKRYTYKFAGVYLIATFPSLKIDIERYPAVKQYLKSFGYDRLKQTGAQGARKRTNNQWFETQDSISYWEDFAKPKIVWKIIGNEMAFSIDSADYIVNNACYILTGPSLEYLLSILNSKTIKWYSYITNMNKTGVGDVQVGAQNVNLFPIPIIPESAQKPFVELVEQTISAKQKNQDVTILESKIEELVNNLYRLTKTEVAFIESKCR